MFYCERCGANFGETLAAVATKCPHCLSEDGVEVTIRFRLFPREAVEAVVSEGASSSPGVAEPPSDRRAQPTRRPSQVQ